METRESRETRWAEERAKEWADHVHANARRYRWGTEAHHMLGDISRDEGGIFYYSAKGNTDYYGHWLTGYGFIKVRFPADATRPLTDDELNWLAEHPVVY